MIQLTKPMISSHTAALLLILASAAAAQDRVILYADAADCGGDGLTAVHSPSENKRWVSGWTDPRQWLEFNPEPGTYHAVAIVQLPAGVKIQIAESQGISRSYQTADSGWQTVVLGHLKKGPAPWRLRLEQALPESETKILGLELIQHGRSEPVRLAGADARQRSGWLKELRYGISPQFAVAHLSLEHFDVAEFASQAGASGAGWVVWPVGSREWYFPGPSTAIDGILPGRTSEQDFILELGLALRDQAVQLIVYLDIMPAADAQWCASVAPRRAEFATELLEDLGQRYGLLVQGWLLADRLSYTEHELRALQQVARTGHPRRVFAADHGNLPASSLWGDLQFGMNSSGDLSLMRGGDGTVTSGLYRGVRDSAWIKLPAQLDRQQFMKLAEPPLTRSIATTFAFAVDQDANFAESAKNLFIIKQPVRPCQSCSGR